MMARGKIIAREADLTSSHDYFRHEITRAKVGHAREPSLLVVKLTHGCSVIYVGVVDPHIGSKLDPLRKPGARHVPRKRALRNQEGRLGRNSSQYNSYW